MQNELTLRQIVVGISGLLAIMTPDGAVEIVNRQILDYFGKTLEELKEWRSTDAVHPNEWLRCSALGQPLELDHRLKGFDGVYRWVPAHYVSELKEFSGIIMPTKHTVFGRQPMEARCRRHWWSRST